MFFSIFVSTTGAVFPWCLREVIDRLFVQKELSLLFPVMLFLTGLMLLYNIFLFLHDYFSEKVKLNLSIHLRTLFLESIFRKKLDFVKNRHSGEFTSILNNDLRLAENIPDLLVRLFFEFPVHIVALFITMLYMNFRLTLFVLVVAPPVYLIMRKTRKFRRAISERKMTIIAKLFSDFQEFISGIKVIKAWNLSGYCSRKFRKDCEDFRAESLKEVKYNSGLRGATALVIVLVINLILFIAVNEIKAESSTPGDYAGFIMAMWMFMLPIKKIGMGYSNLVNATVAAERVLGVLENPGTDEINLEEGVEVESINKIEIVDASYSYDGKAILKDVNMNFEPSNVYLIVGPNGAGKTTIVESLIGFTLPVSGKILFNGLPIEKCNLSSIRSRMSVIWQEILLFNDTVRENIAFTDIIEGAGYVEKYERVLKTAHVHESLTARERDDTSGLAEQGSNFSGGEKQRVCIARALFKDHDVLIMDESNSNISKDIFNKILKAICQDKDGKIIIFVTHDTSCWQYGDIIYTVSDKTVSRKEYAKG
jgi:subfamily B ATP-binding cassette protein MsbA